MIAWFTSEQSPLKPRAALGVHNPLHVRAYEAVELLDALTGSFWHSDEGAPKCLRVAWHQLGGVADDVVGLPVACQWILSA